MFTDIVGYSAMMSKDEKQALQILEKNREIHKSAIRKFNGEFIKEIGDGTLSIFQSSLDAVNCSLEIQKACCSESSLMVRIGIHIGDILLKENDVFGDGVNIASRIEAVGEPGGIYISGRVYEDIKNKTDIYVEFIGKRTLKNINDPVNIYSVIYSNQKKILSKPKINQQGKSQKKSIIIASGILLGIAIIILLIIFNNKYNGIKQKEIGRLEKSIAVLPLKNWSQDEEHAYLGDAIADEIIMQLMNIKEIRVLSLTSTLLYKDNPKPLPQIAEELGVNYIIEGGIQRHNDDLSIRVQFIRARNEDHIWGEEYDGKWKDIYKIQDEIAKNIALQLQTVLSPKEIKDIEKEPTQNFEAYRLYLKGQNIMIGTTKPNITEAINYFKQAIEMDSNFASAWSGLAYSYCLLMWYVPPSMDIYPDAEKAAFRSLELDNNLSYAYASNGMVNLIGWEWKTAEVNFKKAINLNPNHSHNHVNYGLILTYTGRIEEALEEMNKAVTLDPLSVGAVNNLGMAYVTAHNYKEVIKVTEDALNVFSIKDLHTYLGQAYLYEGMDQKALEVFIAQENEFWTGVVYAEMGEIEKAMDILNDIQKKEETGYVSPFFKSLLLFSLELTDQGFIALEKAYENHDLELTEIKTYPLLDRIKSDPRYLEILKKMGLN
jgi:TolB-like protein